MIGSLAGVWAWLHASPLAQAIREAAYAYPALETIHIVGIALIFGSILIYDLRILGWNHDLPLDRLGRLLLPWVGIGFGMNVVSGSLLFISDAIEFAANPALQLKLALILVAGLNAAAFQWRTSRLIKAGAPPAAAKFQAVLSIVIWLSIISAGRMIAYV